MSEICRIASIEMQNRPLKVLFAGFHNGTGNFPAHYHEVWELIYVCDGAVTTFQEHRPIHLTPGMILVNPPGVKHWDVFIRPYHLIYLFVEGSILDHSERVAYDDPDRAFGRVFETILREWDATSLAREEMLQLLAAQLEILFRRTTVEQPSEEGDRCLIEAERLLRMSIATPLTLSEVAKRIGVSRSWLHNAFKQAFGVSPHEYAARIRLEKALALLRHSSHKIAFIASECGYASGGHLTNDVRKATGLNPTGIRTAAQQTLPMSDLREVPVGLRFNPTSVD